ncbi:hypothetical protein PPACK8108_LOCUS18236, partial [Phakopsora pachyrhizi]
FLPCWGWWMQVNKKTGEVNMDDNKEVVSGGEFYFPQENVKIDFSKINGICQIIWMANKCIFDQTIPDTKTDTRLGMSCQVAKKLSTAFEKYRHGIHPSHFK